jgi:hypothetical protein
MNPFSNQNSTHSTWPVVMSLYNLPPWLCKKQKYMMLTIMVSGPKQPGDCIDVYLRPLVDDLIILKPGVSEVWDEFKCEEFTMHARVKERCSLHTLLGRYLRSMAKTFKEIRIYGAPSFPREETSIPGHGLSV